MRSKRKRRYGTGSKRWDARRAAWVVRFPRDAEGRRPVRTFPTEAAADAALKDFERAPVDVRPSGTVATLGEQWLALRDLDELRSSQGDDRCRWRKHVLPVLGALDAAQVLPSHVEKVFAAMRAAGLSGATTERVRALLGGFFSWAGRDTGARNPVRHISAEARRLASATHDPQTTPYLRELGSEWRVYRALPSPARLAYALGVFGGLRPGEALALRWESVELFPLPTEDGVHGVVRVECQIRHGRLGPAKGRRVRRVPIGQALAEILLQHRPDIARGLVVPNSADGGYCNHKMLHRHLRQALLVAGITDGDYDWYHVTRHTFAARAIHAGCSLPKLAGVLGHSMTYVTEHYAHLSPLEGGGSAVAWATAA